MSRTLVFALMVAFAAASPAAADQTAPAAPAKNSVWGGPRPTPPVVNPKAGLLPRISVKGNRFVDPAGQPVLFGGLSIADPDKLVEEGRWNRELLPR